MIGTSLMIRYKMRSKFEILLRNHIRAEVNFETKADYLIQRKTKAESDKSQYASLLDEIDCILEFRELFQTYELEFTQLIPDHL